MIMPVALVVVVAVGSVSGLAAGSDGVAAVTVDPSKVVARLSGAMNGAGMEELNHEIYGGVYAQLIHGESFEEPIGKDGGERSPSQHNKPPDYALVCAQPHGACGERCREYCQGIVRFQASRDLDLWLARPRQRGAADTGPKDGCAGKVPPRRSRL